MTHFFFDAYSATISHPDPDERIDYHAAVDLLLEPVRQNVATFEPGKGMYNYRTSTWLRDHNKELIFVALSGGNPGVHFQTKGLYSATLADRIRSTWPDHRASRVDSAFDLSGAGLFENLLEIFEVFAKANGDLKWEVKGDNRAKGLRDEESGRTFYIGNRLSRCYLRVYEKGLYEMSRRRAQDDPIDRHWIRVELEFKPNDREAKSALAKMEPEAVWGISPWTKKALIILTGIAVPRRILWKPKEPDSYRTVRHMLWQYRNCLGEVIHSEGGYARFLVWARGVWKAQKPALDEWYGTEEHETRDWIT